MHLKYMQFCFFVTEIYTVLQNKRMLQCGVPPPPIIFKRLKLITLKNYIRWKREFIGESKSFEMSGKYFDFDIL